jgi:hypothetical protein
LTLTIQATRSENIRREDRCGERAMGMGRVGVTDVVQKRRDNVINRSSVVEGPGRRLQ